VALLRREHFESRKLLLAGFAALLLLATIHVVPLPHSLWTALPGREELRAVDDAAGLSGQWRPITLAPANGWHALLSLFAPLAVFLLGIQLTREELYKLLTLLIGLSAISGLLGLLQAIGSPDSPLYFYRITNNGSAVGLFANRNHAATLLACMFPMLAAFAATARGTTDEQNRRQLVAAAIAIIIVPLILVTGSRSGLVTATIGLLASAAIYRRPTQGRVVRRGDKGLNFRAVPILTGLAIACLAFLTFYFSRAEAIARLFVDDTGSDKRTDFWIVSFDLFWKYFPVGSGSGSFVEAFQIIEPRRLLDATYLNHAHSDWIEVAVTFGLPGLLLMAAAVLLYAQRSYNLWRVMHATRRSVIFGRMAGAAIAIFAIASVSDYPLRTPTLMCVFTLFTIWFVEAKRKENSGSKTTDPTGNQLV
jgi:O-antigen ligase